MRVIITTVGTSLIGNALRQLNKKPAELTDADLEGYLREAEPHKASAETNSLSRLNTQQDNVILLHTNTSACERCALALKPALVQRGLCKTVEIQQIDLKADEAHLVTHGLRSLVETLIDAIKKARKAGHDPIINATGGLKAEIAYTTMVGMVFEVPVIYIYEDFKDVVTLPPIPIEWDTSLFLEYESFFEWLDNNLCSQQEVSSRLKAIPDAGRFASLITHVPDEEGYLYLTGLGDLLYQRFRQEREESEAVTEPSLAIEKNSDNKVHLPPHDYPQGTKKFAKSVAENPYVEEVHSIRFENTGLSRFKRVNDEGEIIVLWSDGQMGCVLSIQTTARGKAQTLHVQKQLEKLLD